MTNPVVFAAWAQNKDLLEAWVKNGVSVFICPELGNPKQISQVDLHAKIKSLGASYIDRPEGFAPGKPDSVNDVASLNRMIADPKCLAIFLDDEPEIRTAIPNPNPITQPELVGKFDAFVKQWLIDRKWIIDACKTANKPMFLNFTGTSISNGREWGYKGLIQHAFVDSWIRPIDILSGDWYPRNQSPQNQPKRYANSFPAIATKNLKSDFPNVKVWGYVETSKINATSGDFPVPADIEEQVKLQVEAGVDGIAWFSHSMWAGWNPATNPNGWDGRSVENKAKCLELAKKYGAAVPPVVTPPSFDAEAAFSKLSGSFNALSQQFQIQQNLTMQLQQSIIDLKANLKKAVE